MIALPEGFDFHGVYWYRSQADPLTFFYMAGEPTPERTPLGQPTLTLVVSDQGAMLQLGAWWQVTPELLVALRKHMSKQFPELDPALIQLSPAPVTVEEAELWLGDGRRDDKVVATVHTSGFAPYAAVMHTQLTAEETTHVVAALHGRKGHLTVRYRMTLPVEVRVQSSMSGDVRQDISQLGANPSLTACYDQIRIALFDDRRLVLAHTGTNEAPKELWEKADRLAIDQAASLLLEMAHGDNPRLDAARLDVVASLTETIPLPIQRQSDVSSWFPQGTGSDHMQVVSFPINAPRLTKRRVDKTTNSP